MSGQDDLVAQLRSAQRIAYQTKVLGSITSILGMAADRIAELEAWVAEADHRDWCTFDPTFSDKPCTCGLAELRGAGA